MAADTRMQHARELPRGIVAHDEPHVVAECLERCRLELRMLFGALTRRWTSLQVISPPDIEPNIFAGAVRRFELAFSLR